MNIIFGDSEQIIRDLSAEQRVPDQGKFFVSLTPYLYLVSAFGSCFFFFKKVKVKVLYHYC